MKNLSLLFVLGLVLLNSCKKEEFGTVPYTDIHTQTVGSYSAEIWVFGYVPDNDFIYQWGISFSTNPEPAADPINRNNITTYTKSVEFTVTLEELMPLTTYYVQPYCSREGKRFYSNDIISFTTDSAHYVGETGPAGGIIYHLDANGNALEMATTEFNGNWDCTEQIYGALKDLGSGEENTDLILATCPSATSAPAVCKAFDQGGFTNWHLPAYQDLKKINVALVQTGIWTPQNHWYLSSSEGDVVTNETETYYFSYNYTEQQGYNSQKGMNHYYFPVRKVKF